MSDITYAYAGDIVKTKSEDGDLIVYGKATGPDIDLDEQMASGPTDSVSPWEAASRPAEGTFPFGSR